MKKMLNELVRYGKFAFALAFALCCFNASATAITPAEHFAKKVDFTIGGYSGTSTLANFPVLVKLSTSAVSGFSYSDCEQASIRFLDADGNLIPHEVDTWNDSGESFIWVSVPSLSGTSTKITMCYGGNGATCEAATGNVWTDASYKSVWHLNIASNSTSDSATSANTASVLNPNEYCGAGTGLIGGGYFCEQNTTVHALEAPASASASFAPTTANTLTYTAWVRQIGGYTASTSPAGYAQIQWGVWGNCGTIWHTGNNNGTSNTGIGIGVESGKSNDSSAFAYFDAKLNSRPAVANIYDGEWHQVVARYVPNGDNATVTIWVDGQQKCSITGKYTNPSTSSDKVYMGARINSNNDCVWTGDLDEMRFRDAASSDDWIAAEYANVTTASFLSNDGAKNIGDEPLAREWTVREMGMTGAEIRTDGTFKYGYCRHTATGSTSSRTVNGVTFVAYPDETDFNNNQNAVFSPGMAHWYAAFGAAGVEGAWGDMLNNGFYNDSGYENTTLTLNGLTAGKQYVVQIITHNNSEDDTITVGGVTAHALKEYGSSLECEFTATAASESFALTCAGGKLVVNAIQVRELGAAPPSGEWDTAHGTFAKRIAFTASGYEGTEALANFPVLVRLSTSITDFDYSDCGTDGADIRFVDAAGNLLPYEIDTWNTSGESLVWVKVPSLTSSSQFYMYFDGTPSAANTPSDTWAAANYVGVWHMSEVKGSVADATGHGLTAVPTGSTGQYADQVATTCCRYTGTDAPVGYARTTSTAQVVAGNDGRLVIAHDNQLNIGGTFTFSTWVRKTTNDDYTRIVSKKSAYTSATGWEVEVSGNKFNARGVSSGKAANECTGDFPTMMSNWVHVVVVYDNTTITVYGNGEAIKTNTEAGAANDSDRALVIGANASDSFGNRINGAFDECRLLDAVASADWVKAEYQQSAKPTFLVAGTVETHETPTPTYAFYVGGTGYSSWWDAYDHANGATIKVGVNAEMNNVNGHTLSGTINVDLDGQALLISGGYMPEGGNLTIIDKVGSGTISLPNSLYVCGVLDFSQLDGDHLTIANNGIKVGDANSLVKFPSDWTFDYCKDLVNNPVNGARIIAQNVTYTWDGSAWGQVATPVISPATQSFSATFSATITCATDGATIHYTTDGSTPTTSSPTYSSAISIPAETTTLKAIAVKDGMSASEVATATYTYEAPQPTDPAIGSLVITPNGSTAWFSLSGITLGTDSEAVPATSYSVDFAVKNSAGSTIKDGTKLTGQTSSSCSFDVAEIPDGIYTGYVTITTDKDKTATKYAEFTIDTSSEEPTIPLVWTAEPMSGPQSIRTDGTLIYAHMRGNHGNTTYTINTVDFTGHGDTNLAEFQDSCDFAYGTMYRCVHQSVDSNDPYEQMMGLNWRGGSGGVNLTLKNLVAGNTYLVQLVLRDTENRSDNPATTSPDGTVTASATGDGGTLVGVFKANGATETFKLDSSGIAIINAIQVRDVSPVETIEPKATAALTRQAIQDAIDRAAPAHRQVKLSVGTFLIDKELFVTNGVTLTGQGWKNTIIKQTATTKIERVVSINGGAKVEGVTLTGGDTRNGTDWGTRTGAGAAIYDGTISWCCISNNISSANNGRGSGVGFPAGRGSIDHTIIAENKSDANQQTHRGSAIGFYNTTGAITVDTCLIFGNTGNGSGMNSAAISGTYNAQSTGEKLLAVLNTTITDNPKGAIYLDAGDAGSLLLVNDIISGNGSKNVAINSTSVLSANSANCIFGTADSSTLGSSVQNSAFYDNLGFVDAANGDYHLGDYSVAYAAGTAYDGIDVDLDNKPFAAPPSIGCYEYAGSGIQPEDTAAETRQTIQDAIDAVAPAHGTVHLGEGLFEIDQQLYVTNGVTLAGQGYEKTIIKQTGTAGTNDDTKRCVTMKDGAQLIGLTLTGGNTTNNGAGGAGVYVDSGDATISRCCVTNNTAWFCGGGIGIGKSGTSAAPQHVKIDHTIVADNSSTGSSDYPGAGIGTKAGYLELEVDTCLIYGNHNTSKDGGGIGLKAGASSNYVKSRIVNTTIADNSTTGKGGGIWVENVSNQTVLNETTLINCIFSGNSATGTAEFGDANVGSNNEATYNLMKSKSGCCFFGASSTAETAFGAFAKTGDVGFVGDGNYHLAANSPAIAAGSTIAADRVDLDNVAFVAPPSVGCYEYESSVPAPKFTPASGTKFQTQLEVRINGQGTVYYTTDGTVPTEGSSTYSSARTISDTTKFMARAYVGGVWSAVATATYVKAAPDAGDYYVSMAGSDFADGLTPETAFKTIAHAVEVANDGQKVTVLPGTFEIDETIVIDKAITVTGSGWDKTTIQPTSGTKIRLFELDGGAKLEGVTLTGGNVSGGDGAAAVVKNGMISWCYITNNKSTGSSGCGAAVAFLGGQGTIDHCVVTKNTGTGTYCCGSVGARSVTAAIIVIDTCLIYDNTTWNVGGVGIVNGSPDVTIRNCTIANNKGSGYGGITAHDCSGATVAIINTISVGNDKSNIYVSPNSTSSVSTQNCIFEGEAQFTNAREGDYHPSAGWEDVIGKGVTYAGIGDTLDGMPFNDPPSIGCYEPSIGFGKVTFAYPAKHEGTATVQLIGLSDGATTADVTFQYGPDSEHLCEPIEVVNGVGINTDIVATMSGLNANCEYAYLFTAVDDKGERTTRSGIFTTDDWDTLQFSTVKANPTSNSADVSVTIMKLGLGATNATVYVQWGTNYNDLCEAVRISTTAQQKQTLTYTITGLKNDKDYVVRFSGENDVGDTATRDGAFKTLEMEKLALGEPKVSNLGQTTADIAVTVPTLGENAKSATVTLKWWIDGTTDTNSVVMSSAAVRGSSLSQQLTGLTANTLYRYEIVAVNDLPAPDTGTNSVSGGFTTDNPNIGADDYHDSYPTVDANHVVTYDADSAGNPSTLEPGSPYVVVTNEGYGVSHIAGGKKYWFRNEYDYQYNCSARIGDTYYLFLTDAVAEAQANDKIELLRNNYAISETMQINRKLTIEGNGYAVKVAAPFLDSTGYVNPKCTATPKTVFKIGTGGDVVINDMLVMGGGEQLATGGAGSNSANEPAIVVTDTGILEMDHVTVKRSQGGLWIDQKAKVHLNACNLVKNARFCGGGFYSKGVLVMENSSLSENRSLSSGGGGAAAENQGLLVMNNCVICNNGSTEYGGAINNLNNTSSSGIVYMMNMTMAGNFSSHASDYGGGIGLHQSSGDLYMLNCILCNNYHYITTSGSEDIDVSDIRSDSGNNHFLYSVYGVCTGGTKSEFTNCFPVVAADQDVFKGYSPFARTYEQNQTTVVPIPGPSFDTAPSNEDARYAPLSENGSEADVGNDGVYTYFDASAWRSAAGNKDVSWLEMAYREEGETTLTALGKCAGTADEEDLVTTYYETAFDPTISDRELGVVGASGFGTHKKTYTLYLLANPVNGGVSDNLILTGKSYDQGAEVTVIATPDAKCTFLGWFDAKEATEPVSTKLAYTFVMDSDKSLLARFSEPSETHRFIKIECEQEEGTHDLFPIEITKDWLKSEFGYEPKTEEQFNAIETVLNEPDPANGLNHKWMNYVLGLNIGDPDGKIWIRGSQNSDSGKLTFSVQELSETKDCGFIVRYRLPKMNLTKDETSYNREGEYINTKKGTFEDAVSDDLQYRIIDMIFIPTNANTRTGKPLNTSFEYVTTVNTAGVMKVTSDKKVEILASPWVGFSPTNNPTIKATDYVKASCLNKDDVLYIYDRAHSNYLAWAVQDGQWAQKDTYQIINGVVYRDDDPADISNTNSLPRGMGAWLERSNTKSPIYLYGQVDPSPVTTQLEPGFNLVGNPYPFEYDASQLPPGVDDKGVDHTGMYGDHIVIPMGADPINAIYDEKEQAWMWPSNSVAPMVNPKTGKPMLNPDGTPRMSVKDIWTTEGLTLPIGHGFWYNNTSGRSMDLNWASED